jgi:hypothetical protein
MQCAVIDVGSATSHRLKSSVLVLGAYFVSIRVHQRQCTTHCQTGLPTVDNIHYPFVQFSPLNSILFYFILLFFLYRNIVINKAVLADLLTRRQVQVPFLERSSPASSKHPWVYSWNPMKLDHPVYLNNLAIWFCTKALQMCVCVPCMWRAKVFSISKC